MRKNKRYSRRSFFGSIYQRMKALLIDWAINSFSSYKAHHIRRELYPRCCKPLVKLFRSGWGKCLKHHCTWEIFLSIGEKLRKNNERLIDLDIRYNLPEELLANSQQVWFHLMLLYDKLYAYPFHCLLGPDFLQYQLLVEVF